MTPAAGQTARIHSKLWLCVQRYEDTIGTEAPTSQRVIIPRVVFAPRTPVDASTCEPSHPAMTDTPQIDISW